MESPTSVEAFQWAGQAQHIAASYRPRGSALLASRLVGEHFTGTPIAEYFSSSGD
jgi:hypothetical protein